MYVWRFKQFRAWSGRRAIDDWRLRLSPTRRAVFDTFMDRIAKMQSWPPGICDPIGNHAGCWELRWTAEKVEHRILGYFGGGKEFNMMVACVHKGKIYDPPGAFETLDQRKRQVQEGTGGLDEYTIWPD
jgi:hypothetical protein